jgi:hypothetical protein
MAGAVTILLLVTARDVTIYKVFGIISSYERFLPLFEFRSTSTQRIQIQVQCAREHSTGAQMSRFSEAA